MPDYVKDHVQSSCGAEPAPSKEKERAVASYAKNVTIFNVGPKILTLSGKGTKKLIILDDY